MKPYLRPVCCLLFVLLSACRGEIHVVSGSIGTRALTDSQIVALNGWLQSHRKDWQMIVATPPPPDCVAQMAQANGRGASLYFYRQPGWLAAAQINVDDRHLQMSSTPEDIASLRQALQCAI